MRFEDLRRRLAPLPTQLPPMRRELMPVLLSEPGTEASAAGSFPSGPRRIGAVLVLFHPGTDGAAHVLLTERSAGEHRHAGQISFPGGAVEAGESPVEAALREAREEVGLRAQEAGVEIVGSLPSVDVRVSGFIVQPIVATAPELPELVPDGREVATVISAGMAAFLPEAPIEIVLAERDGVRLRYGAFRVGDHLVWGATAGILARLGAHLASGGDS